MDNVDDSIEAASDFVDAEDLQGEEKKTVDLHTFLAEEKDFITCRKCKKEFDHEAHKPFLLPCLDAICKSCIFECPSYECVKCCHCHTCFQNDKLSLEIDNTREIASEIYRLKMGDSSLVCEMCTKDHMASHRCFECSIFICEDCVKVHLSLKRLKSHSVVEIKAILSGNIKNLGLSYAPKHCPVAGHKKEQLKLHCTDPSCMKNVCVLCAISTHKDHNLCDITEVGKKLETIVETYLKSLRSKVRQGKTSIAKISDVKGSCSKKSQELLFEIKTRFSEAKRALEKRESDLCNAVASHCKEKQTYVESEQKKITSFINLCTEAGYYAKISLEINDKFNFVDIANVILPQLEILEEQLPEIEIPVDTMTLSSQLSEDCFETALNSLGKLSVSKVDSSKSKVVVTHSVCEVGQQIQFQIQLFSSAGISIVDENVSAHLKLNGITFKILKCAFDAVSSSFTGYWVPDKQLKISWIVVSNDIEFRNLNGVIDVRKTDINITADKEMEETLVSNVNSTNYNNAKFRNK